MIGDTFSASQILGYTITNAWANIPGLIKTIEEEGIYDLFNCLTFSFGTAKEDSSHRFAINGVGIDGPMGYAADIGQEASSICIYGVRLKAGDVVTVQAIYQTSATTIPSSVASCIPSLQIARRA